MSAAKCLQRFSHSCLTIKSHLRLFINWIDIECGHFWSIKLTLLGVNTEYGRRWSSTLVVKPMRCSSNHPLWPACKIHFRIKMAMKISTNRKLEHFANQEISQFVLHLRNRSHLCDKWPRQVKGIHLCNSTSLQFSGDRAFVCVEPLPLRPFLCNFDAQPSFVWGTYLWASYPARTIVVYWQTL